MISPLRNHPSYLTAIAHRVSGLALALFLPFHFFLLAQAMQGVAGLDRALVFTELPLVKIAEWGLVSLLVLHLFFGLRVLMLELSRWPNHREKLTSWIIPGVIIAIIFGVVFLVRVF